MATYEPKRVKTNVGLYGTATVELGVSKGKPAAKVTFVDGDSEGKSFFISKDNCPAYIQAGRWNVRLSHDGKEMQGMSPINGRYRGKVAKFVAPKGKEPAPYTQKMKTSSGKEFLVTTFMVILEFTQGKCKGMQVTYKLNYIFVEAEDGTVGVPKSKSKYNLQTERFLKFSGAWERGEMPYVDNALPNFEKRILRANKEFDIQMVDGWVDALYPLGDDEVTETPKATYGEPEVEPDPNAELDDVIDPNDPMWEEAEK